MAYFRLRLCCEHIFPDGNWPADKAKFYPFFKLIIEKKVLENTSYTCGFEELDKFGDVRPKGCHFHFHFQSSSSRETLRKWLRENFQRMYDTPLRGANAYYCRCDPEPNDHYAWLRYPLKELPVKRFCGYTCDLLDCSANHGLHLCPGGPACDFTKSQHEIAAAEMIRRHKHNRDYREKQKIKKTLFDRICVHLDDHCAENPDACVSEIFRKIQDFYIAEKRPLNVDTMSGYCSNYCVTRRIIPPDILWQGSTLKHLLDAFHA